MDEEANGPLESRPPTKEDFLEMCRQLNAKEVDYIVVGGMAVIQHGLLRATEDIDLLVKTTPENESRLIDALMYLPDQAVRELQPGDINQYTVIRVADEIVIDLMKSACGINFDEAESSILWVTLDDVRIPFANLELLWRMKQTHREKDAMDLDFIRQQLIKLHPGN